MRPARDLAPTTLAAALLLAPALLVVACGEDVNDPTPTPTDPPVATSLSISPTTVQMASLGETAQLTATVTDQYGQAMAGAPVSWASSDDAVATVNAGGTVTSVQDGSATVTATSGSASATAAVTVAQVAARVDISPSTLDTFVSVGDTVRLTGRAVDAMGTAVAAAALAWSSSDTLVATVDSAGLVTSAGSGAADIAASAGGASSSVGVTVAQVIVGLDVIPAAASLHSLGDSLQLFATGVDANGHPAPGLTFRWESEHPATATVDDNGLVIAVRTGSTDIFAYNGEAYDSAGVTVIQFAVGVQMTPEGDTLAVGDTLRIHAVAVDARGNEVEDTDYIWTALSPMVATVDSVGLVTAVGPGMGVITAKATRAGGNHIGRTVITVVQPSG